MENPGEKLAEKKEAAQPPTVIKFGNPSPTEKTVLPPVQMSDSEKEQPAPATPIELSSGADAAPISIVLSGFSPSLGCPSPSPSTLADSKELIIDTDVESVSSQPTELQLQVKSGEHLPEIYTGCLK